MQSKPSSAQGLSISSLDSGASTEARTGDLNDDAQSITTVGTGGDSGIGTGVEDGTDGASGISAVDENVRETGRGGGSAPLQVSPDRGVTADRAKVATEGAAEKTDGGAVLVEEKAPDVVVVVVEETREEARDQEEGEPAAEMISEMLAPALDMTSYEEMYHRDEENADNDVPPGKQRAEDMSNEEKEEDEEDEEEVDDEDEDVDIQLPPPEQREEDHMVLPSDKAWRNKNYFVLVEKQRLLGSTPMASAKDFATVSPWVQDPRQTPPPAHWLPLSRRPPIPPPQMSAPSSMAMGAVLMPLNEPGLDLAKAGSLLQRGIENVEFSDEAEMRRVLELIYDAYRYSSVLESALMGSGFYKRFPELTASRELDWLLLLDLHRRRYRPRSTDQSEQLQFFGLTNPDLAIWSARVDLAAAMSGLRVRNGAVRLSELLPLRLRDGRQPRQIDALITGWVNVFRTRPSKAINRLEQQGLQLRREPVGSRAGLRRTQEAREQGTASVSNDEFRKDPVLPFVLLLHPEQRPELSASGMLRPDRPLFVLQDRAFCLGPALLARVVADYDLRGDVAQTHVATPRATAYLAATLSANPRVGRLIAFGAGRRCKQYRAYLRRLGVRNICVLEQSWSYAHDTPLIGNVVAVLATPPNSCSAVTDPVDLACSRGGDLALLRQFTGVHQDTTATDSPLIADTDLIAEQTQTMRFCMGKPHVQVIVYETHSNKHAENGALVANLIDMMNEEAFQKHYDVAKRAAWIAAVSAAAAEQRRIEPGDVPPPAKESIDVPDCDLYEIAQLPDICPAQDSCLILREQGCYLSLIQRKEVVRMDANYMIRMAEARGLFGSPTPSRPSHAERARRRREREAEEARARQASAGDHRRGAFCLERISAPTLSWLEKVVFDSESTSCPRYTAHWCRSLRCRMIRSHWREAARVVAASGGASGRLRLGRLRRRRKTLPIYLCSLQMVDVWRHRSMCRYSFFRQ